MIFLVEYDRSESRLLRMRTFPDTAMREVEDVRLALELDLNRKHITREVVILQAVSEAALRRTHGRYFRTQAISRS